MCRSLPCPFTDKERSRIRTRLRAVARTAMTSATFRPLTVDALALAQHKALIVDGLTLRLRNG